MICGVNIGGKDTLAEWGLMLCNDLTIGPAVPRYRFITIPEMSGALDLTESLTGSVPYDQRTISFTLFAVHDVIAGTRHPATEEHFETVRSRLSGFANGKRMHIYLPDIPDHYFIGRVSVGGHFRQSPPFRGRCRKGRNVKPAFRPLEAAAGQGCPFRTGRDRQGGGGEAWTVCVAF